MKNKSLLVVISGPSGSGKTTLRDEMFKIFKDFRPSISTTTRPMRSGEVNGKDYFFIQTSEFQDKIKNKGFVEWAEVYGNYYGTSREFIENSLNQGTSLILVLDVQGAENIKKIYKDKALLIFVETKSLDELKKRLEKRGTDSPEVIAKRLDNALIEISHKKNYDFSIINNNLKKAVHEMADIITNRFGS
jgi:guanylate kinase